MLGSTSVRESVFHWHRTKIAVAVDQAFEYCAPHDSPYFHIASASSSGDADFAVAFLPADRFWSPNSAFLKIPDRIAALPAAIVGAFRASADTLVLGISASKSSEADIAIGRTVRSAFLSTAKRSGALQIHGSAAERRGSGVIFVGAKFAGKTTMLLELMRLGWRFVSNDDVLLFPDGTLAGVPTAVGIRASTLEQFPQLSALKHLTPRNVHRPCEPVSSGRKTVSVSRLCELFNSSPCATATTTDIVFLERSAIGTKPIGKLDPIEGTQRLKDHLKACVSEHEPFWEDLGFVNKQIIGSLGHNPRFLRASLDRISPLELCSYLAREIV